MDKSYSGQKSRHQLERHQIFIESPSSFRARTFSNWNLIAEMKISSNEKRYRNFLERDSSAWRAKLFFWTKYFGFRQMLPIFHLGEKCDYLGLGVKLALVRRKRSFWSGLNRRTAVTVLACCTFWFEVMLMQLNKHHHYKVGYFYRIVTLPAWFLWKAGIKQIRSKIL